MSVAAMQKRLSALERPKNVPGDCLWLSCTGQDVTTWRGGCGRDQRAWHRLENESPDDFRARVRREALPAGIFCLSGFDVEGTVTPAASGN